MAGETTPLLLPDPHKQGAGSRWRELRILAGLSFPLFLMNYLRFFIQACGVFSVAQLGTVELAASSLGMMTVNAFGIALLVGFIGGSLNTLANQAATSQNQQLASVYCIRTFIISMQITPLLMILLCATGPLFRALLPNADAEMIKLASNYCSIASLALPPLALSECIRRYCQAFGKVAGPAIGYTIAAPVAIALNYFLIISPYVCSLSHRILTHSSDQVFHALGSRRSSGSIGGLESAPLHHHRSIRTRRDAEAYLGWLY